MMEIKVGCCGYPVGKKRYYKDFDVVELQQTFYSMPSSNLVKKWVSDVPEGFTFTIKASQLITHPHTSPTYRRLNIKIPPYKLRYYGFFADSREVMNVWDHTAKIASIMKANIILFQTPASFRCAQDNINKIRKFFRRINRKHYTFVWEPRGNWPSSAVRGLCTELDLVHCVDPFVREPVYGKIIYFRLHGKGGYRYKYSDEELKGLLRKVKAYNLPAYIMFNNTNMYYDALRFKNLLTS